MPGDDLVFDLEDFLDELVRWFPRSACSCLHRVEPIPDDEDPRVDVFKEGRVGSLGDDDARAP